MTKTLFTILLVVSTVEGCAKLPSTPASSGEVERVVSYHVPRSTAHLGNTSTQTQVSHYAPDGTEVGLYVDHATAVPLLAESNGPGPLPAATASRMVASARAGAASSQTVVQGAPASATAADRSTDPLDSGAKALAVGPGLTVVKSPSGSYRAFPMFNSQNQVVSAQLSPSTGKATWQVQATHGGPIISKVKIVLADQTGANTIEADDTTDDLSWPTHITGTQSLTLPIAAPFVANFLQAHPNTTDLTLQVSLVDTDGAVVPDQDGQPLTLSLPMSVN